MKTSKVNIGLAISRNFSKVTVEVMEEPIEYESDEEFRAKIRQKFKIIREEVDLEFQRIK